MASKISLTKDEINYILWACHVPDGFLDFENNTETSFEEYYSFSMEQANNIKKSIQDKLNPKKQIIPLQ